MGGCDVRSAGGPVNDLPAFSRRDTQSLERAYMESAEGSSRPAPVHRQGLIIVRMWTVRAVPVELNSDQLLRAVRLAQHYREGPPQIRLDERQITWRDRQGIIFHLESADGRTEVRVRVSRFLLRRARMDRWVRAAADRLAAIIRLVGEGEEPARPASLPRPPRSQRQGARDEDEAR